MFHRPDEPHAAFDLAVVEHQARSGNLHGGAARLAVDQQQGAGIGEPAQRLVERDRPVALPLRDRRPKSGASWTARSPFARRDGGS
jgi:hypothetical protein